MKLGRRDSVVTGQERGQSFQRQLGLGDFGSRLRE